MIVPRDYQMYGAVWAVRRRGGILGFEVGLGKTLSAVLASQIYGAKRILVIVPLSLKAQWFVEIQKYGGQGVENLKAYPLPTLTLPDGRVFHLAHYEQFRSLRVNGETIKNRPSEVTAAILRINFDALLVDECHKLSGRGSQWTIWIKKVDVPFKLGLTGTPITDYPVSLWSQLNWLDPKRFNSYWTFVNLYCETADNYGRKEVLGLKRHKNECGVWTTEQTLALLKEATKDYLLIRRQEDVGLELPPYQVIDVPIQMGDDQAHFYREVKKQAIVELTQEFGEPGTWDLSGRGKLFIQSGGGRFTRLQQVASAPTVFKPGISNAKLDWLKTWVEGSDVPALILTRFVHTVDRIKEIVPEGYTVGAFESLGTGLNFQNYRVTIMFDPPKSRMDYEQAVGRTHRMGQEHNQLIYRLSCVGTVNKRSWELVDQKDLVVNEIIAWLKEVQNDCRNG